MGAAFIGLVSGVLDAALLQALPARVLGLAENDLLQAMPLYVFMGVLLNRLPLAETLLRTGSRALARSGAGVPLAGLGLGVLLAPMNGSVGAGVAMLTRTVLPRLDAQGVERERSAALVAVTSTLGVVVPPSLVLILLSDAMLRAHTEALNITHVAQRILNTQDVFRAALVPAGVLLLLCALITWRTAKAAPASGDAAPPGRAERWTAIGALIAILALFAGVILGFLYAVEAAATGACALLAFACLRGALTRSVLVDVLRDTLIISGALFALLVGATMFTLVLRAFGTDRWVAALLASAGASGPLAALFAVMATLMLCAFVLDAFEMIFVIVPVLMPPLLVQVADAVWVAVVTLLILQLSFLLPPFGYAVMMLRNRIAHKLDGRRFIAALLPYLVAQCIVLALVLAFPGMLWRDRSTLPDAPTTGQKPLTDREVDEEMRRQTEPQGEPR